MGSFFKRRLPFYLNKEGLFCKGKPLSQRGVLAILPGEIEKAARESKRRASFLCKEEILTIQKSVFCIFSVSL